MWMQDKRSLLIMDFKKNAFGDSEMENTRVEPLKASELDEKQREYVKPFTNTKGQFPNIFGALMHNMELFEAWADFGSYTMSGSRMDPVLREVLVLRTAVNNDCDYEWHHHRRIGMVLGLSKELIENIRGGKALESEEQHLMMECADDLAKNSKLSDTTWDKMIQRFGLEYTMDVVFTVGAYTALGMGLKSCGVQIEK